MKIAVIGAGIVGVTTAYELSADGHRVTVFERRGSVAAEASFANAGVVSPAGAAPWATPSVPAWQWRHLLRRRAPVQVHWRMGADTAAWLWKWRRASQPRHQPAHRTRMLRLAEFSASQLREITRSLHIDYERSEGSLLLLRTPDDQAAAEHRLAAQGLTTGFKLLSAEQCRQVEPGLCTETPLHGGLHWPTGEAGNCREFAHLLRQEAQQLGARFLFHTLVSQIIPGAHPQVVHCSEPPQDGVNPKAEASPSEAQDTQPMWHQPITEGFDAIVVCAAMDSVALLRPHGVQLPLQAVHGYSLTAPLRLRESHDDIGPRATLLDERHQLAITRLGSRVRIAGGCEIGGHTAAHHPRSVQLLYKVLHDWFPGAARTEQAQLWKGARPMLPDGAPIVGNSGLPSIWLNLGHGSSGWALACGSASLLTDALAGRPPRIDTAGLGLDRLRKG